MDKPNLYILIGLPGSGKSTWARRFVETSRSTVVVSSDSIRKELFGDESVQSNPNRVFSIVNQRVKENLLHGKSVILDATNLQKKFRKNYIEEYSDLASVIAVYFDTPIEKCLLRDSSRDRTVGESVIRRMSKKLEIPSSNEGWQYIIFQF